jgi:acyl phosphate:glycerol-3-phosphate acyltransferase
MFDQLFMPAAVPFLLLGALGGYLLGSIPFGLILTRLAGTQDLRSIGSGNIGATNVLRTGRKDLAIATLLLDGLKGTAAVTIGAMWGVPMAVWAGAGAFFGHLFPLWLKFKGGKGVATFIGVLLGLHWPSMLIFAAIWLGMAFLFRYSSLSALVATALTPIVLWFFNRPEEALLAVVMGVFLFLKHRPNIERLLAGTESRIGQKA